MPRAVDVTSMHQFLLKSMSLQYLDGIDDTALSKTKTFLFACANDLRLLGFQQMDQLPGMLQCCPRVILASASPQILLPN
jgi:hypothetical protein